MKFLPGVPIYAACSPMQRRPAQNGKVEGATPSRGTKFQPGSKRSISEALGNGQDIEARGHCGVLLERWQIERQSLLKNANWNATGACNFELVAQ